MSLFIKFSTDIVFENWVSFVKFSFILLSDEYFSIEVNNDIKLLFVFLFSSEDAFKELCSKLGIISEIGFGKNQFGEPHTTHTTKKPFSHYAHYGKGIKKAE